MGLLAVVSALALTAATTSAESFTRGATVVVLTGLPGDVESERAYEDQMGRLLDGLARPAARPAHVFVLTDAPERVTLPAALTGDVRVGSRQSLLGLAREVSAQPGPLVAILWGHGGAQGTKPVFHVRGPRVDVADLLSFAQASGARASRWILYFRGSGAFAAALAGEGREVLASEHQTAFRSDPVGMELLVQRLRADPEAGFTALAERVGRATAEWYESQRLARTEEPTLWSGDAARRLATETPTTLASGSPTPAAATAEEPAAAAPERGSGWTGITPVPASSHPGADAVILRRVDRFTFGESPALVHEVDEFVQVLTEEGEARGDVDVSFHPPDERVVFLDCEVQRADGTFVRVPTDDLHTGVAKAPPAEYAVAHRQAFSFPGVSPGAILRLHYRREWRRFPLPHLFVEAPLAFDVPRLESQVEVRAGADTRVHHFVAGGPAVEPVVRETPSGRVYSWQFTAAPAVASEALAPPDLVPRLLLSTFPDWAGFREWYQRLIQIADVVTPEIEAKAAELVRGKTGEREKVVALYDFVTSLRYVAVPLGVNSHRPHAADGVLKNRYGDCKDKANLFNTLLKTQGIAAHLVLVPRFTQAHAAVPGLGFNHAISRVRVDGEWIFADTTDEFARFGLLPPGDPGRNVLVVDGQSNGLSTLSAPRPEDHRVTLTAEVPWEKDGPATLTARASGFADYTLRQIARGVAGAGATRPLLAEMFRPLAGGLGVRSQTHTPVSALDREFEWTAEGTWTGLVADLGERRRLVRAPFWLPGEWDVALHARRTGLFLNQGYPLVLEENIRLALPARAGTVRLPIPSASDAGPLRHHLAWSQPRADTLEARLRVELTSGELDVTEAAAFRAQLQVVLAALGEGAVYTTMSP
jgi:hypothetical protein